MRGWAAFYLPDSAATYAEAIDDFERALRIDPQEPQALIGLSSVLGNNVNLLFSANPAEDADRAEALASQALSAHPESAAAHFAKAGSLWAKHQWDAAIAEAETAVALDPNLAPAHARAGYFKVYIGRAAEAFAGVETALRLSPHGPYQWAWEYWICDLHEHLAQ